ncbi:hypothetical protein HDU87_005785 [Geranomyces variabilis]|uniref:PH domain-containing protein n=1 Tax=Geranomyces variabilis TaxID=109894 RepID=A0AAD5XNU1_9FUNG|nr:hypothetical protein HDU87_005785 [Geranomyces variabilis]
MSPSPFLLPSARGSVLPAAPSRQASWATSSSSDSSSANTADENPTTIRQQQPTATASTSATASGGGGGGGGHTFSLPQQPPLPAHHLHQQQQQQQHYQQPVQQPLPQPRTIVCEGKLSVLLNMPGGGGGSASAAAAKEDWKMRRRSLDVLKMAFAGVLGGGGGGSGTGASSNGGGGGGGGTAMLGATSGTDTQGRSLAKDKWRNVRGWLDDAALLHLEGCTFPVAIPPPSVSISLGPRASSSSSSTGSGTDSRPPPTSIGGRGAGAGAGRPRIKWRFSQDYAARKSTDSGGGGTSGGGSGQLGGYSRKSLDVWDRRSWSIDGDASNRTDTNIPFSPSQTSLFFTAAAPTRPTMLTTFHVLACSAPDPSQTFLVLHVQPYTAHPAPSSSSSTLLTSKALEAASGSSTETLVSTLYIRFTSAAKLERWRAALTLSLCVAQARAEVDVARGARARYEAAEQARLDAEREKEAVERTARKEKKAFEKKVREMFSAEEVQDVYQETADDLAAAEKRITALEATLAAERAAKKLAVASLAQYRQETELPVGEHNALLLRHEELCRRYADLRRDAMLVKALYDKEKTAHGRLARLLRRQAEDGAAVAVAAAAADEGGSGGGGGGLLAAPTDGVVLSPPPSPALDALALIRASNNDYIPPTPSASSSSSPSSLLAIQDQQQQQQSSPTLRAAHQLLPAEIERRVSVDWQRY